ncbi:MAG: type II secretion system F family protein [Steroidobacteraceae bacterium]
MDAYLPAVLAAAAGMMLVLLPFALRGRAGQSATRDTAWRDRLPWALKVLRPLLRWYASNVDAALSSAQRDLMQSRLNAAGAAYMITPAELVVLRRFAFVVGGAIACYVLYVLKVNDPTAVALAACLGPCVWLYPDICLRDAVARRRLNFEKQFPFFLDVLVLSMKAGLTFTAAVEQSIEPLCDGPVKQEFARYLRETRTGSARRIALDRLAARVVIPAVTNFTASVIQAEETGGSLGEVLADQARQRRQERFLRAEKLANQAPVKMLFPLTALLFPVTFIIIGFPIVIQLRDAGVLEMFR